MHHARVNERLWSIVLAGGEGERVRPLVQRWLGQHKPKQYCTFVGTRSMFQHTLDRAGRLVPPERTVTVVARAHQQEVRSQVGKRNIGTVLLQPKNRDTAAGVFLPLAYVRACDPQATVVIYPSDHFVHPEDSFVEAVRREVWAAECAADQVAVIELSGVLWSDWGKPDRIADTLRRIGKQPAFPLEHLAAGQGAHSGSCVLDVSGGAGLGLPAAEEEPAAL